MRNKGTIIILNGPSSAGKSSIQREFQKITSEVFLATGIDDFHLMLPEHYLGESTPNHSGINVRISEENGHRLLTVEWGAVAQKVIEGMHHSLAALASTGNNIIVDYIQYHQTWLSDCKKILKDYKVYFIGVFCQLEELERREKDRSLTDSERTGIVGHARSHYNIVHNNCDYDFVIHSDKKSPKNCAEQLNNFLISQNSKKLP